MADLLFESDMLSEREQMSAEVKSPDEKVQAHLAECEACRAQLKELRATMAMTMAMMDEWVAPEPNPYFLTRLNARLDEEREAVPAGWFENLRARLMYGSRLTMRPVAAMAMAVALLVGGGTYLGFNNPWAPPVAPPAQAAVVHDLQTLDNNAQLLDQLESLSSQNND
jgi:anti-sigma factor RsiW